MVAIGPPETNQGYSMVPIAPAGAIDKNVLKWQWPEVRGGEYGNGLPAPVATHQYVVNGERVWCIRGDLNANCRDYVLATGRGGAFVDLSKRDLKDVRRTQDKVRDTKRHQMRDAKMNA